MVGFGAAAKGNTLLSYCGVDRSQILYVVDETPAKIGKYLPGSHIPVVPIESIMETRPGFILILAWNYRNEIMRKLHYVREWGAKFVVPIPKATVVDFSNNSSFS